MIWSDVSPDPILGFLRQYNTHEAAQKAQAKALGDYVEGRVRDSELIRWTVLLASSTSPKSRVVEFAGHRIGLIRRAALGDKPSSTAGRYDIRRLVNPADELVDLSPEQRRIALAATVAGWDRDRAPNESDADRPTAPSGQNARKVREPEQGLLLLYPLTAPAGVTVEPVIGFAISFPTSRFDSAVDFVVNQVWMQQEFQWDE
jgi:hypothetical protein